MNDRLGGYDALVRFMAAGRGLNATVTFSDNYDDAYKSSPAWDPDIIARRPDGEPWKGRNWTGEDSYIIGLAKYMSLGQRSPSTGVSRSQCRLQAGG